MKHIGDVTKVNGAEIPKVDVITFGAPCQDLSVAGKRKGMLHSALGDDETTRSGLFFEAIRIIKEMREDDKKNGRTAVFIRPRFAIYENVPGAFSSNKGKDFQAVLTEIVRIADPDAPDVPLPEKGKWAKAGSIMGYGKDGCPFSIAYRLHDAQYWGAAVYSDDGVQLQRGTPQRRKRIALVADFGGLAAPEVLFEREGLSGNIEQSGSEGKDATTGFEGGFGKPDKCLNGWDVQSKHVQPREGIAESLYAGECRYGGGESYVCDSTDTHS